MGAIDVLDFQIEKKRVEVKSKKRRPNTFYSNNNFLLRRTESRYCGVIKLYYRGYEPVSIDVFIAGYCGWNKVKSIKRSRLLKPNKTTTIRFSIKAPSIPINRWKIEDIHVYAVG
ncbi:MAG: hypothetical protein GXO58_09025 [Thermodesulfobacteria bacterium]|nr:hypothetical protein [Thermodesulfobacteriota bacterium]